MVIVQKYTLQAAACLCDRETPAMPCPRGNLCDTWQRKISTLLCSHLFFWSYSLLCFSNFPGFIAEFHSAPLRWCHPSQIADAALARWPPLLTSWEGPDAFIWLQFLFLNSPSDRHTCSADVTWKNLWRTPRCLGAQIRQSEIRRWTRRHIWDISKSSRLKCNR